MKASLQGGTPQWLRACPFGRWLPTISAQHSRQTCLMWPICACSTRVCSARTARCPGRAPPAGAGQANRIAATRRVRIAGPLEWGAWDRLIEELDHTVLPCPVRRLEFVCYDIQDVIPVAHHPHYQLALDTGTDIARHVSTDPSTESSHWFLLDLAAGRDLGRPLYGPSQADLLTAVPRASRLRHRRSACHRRPRRSDAPSAVNAAIRTIAVSP